MAYCIRGLDPDPFRPLFDADPGTLAAEARLVQADSATGFPCRVSLADAAEGETLLLVHHVSHEADTPFRAAFAIYVRERAAEAASFTDCVPPAIDRRTLTLRAFDTNGMLRTASLAFPGEADAAIRGLFEDGEVDAVHIHTASPGCFLARATRRP